MTHRFKLLAAAVTLVAVGAGGGAIANAATSQPTATGTAVTSAVSSQPAATASPHAMSMPAHGTASHEDAEKAVTGDAATKAQAAAVKAVGSGTAGAVTTDYTGSGYEVTVTKSDGSSVEIHLDGSFNVMQGHSGFGN